MFKSFPKTRFKVIKTDNSYFEMQAIEGTKGKMVSVEHSAIAPNIIEKGDILEAYYSNGTTEKYMVIDPGFYERFGPIAEHYQIKIQSYNKSNQNYSPFSIRNSNGNIVINQNSPNSNINVNQELSVFENLRKEINKNESIENKEILLNLIKQMQNNVNDKKSFAQHYGEFISSAANHMTIIAPFIPILSGFLGS